MKIRYFISIVVLLLFISGFCLSFQYPLFFAIPTFIICAWILMGNTPSSNEIDKVEIMAPIRFRKIKEIIHESGTFCIEHNTEENKYFLYKDSFIKRKVLKSFEDQEIKTPEDLSNRIKRYLDAKYKIVLDKKKRKMEKFDILHQWDGYTSDQIRREDKIKKII